MVYLVGFLLFTLAAWFVAYPIFRPKTSMDEDVGGQTGIDPDRSGTALMLEELELDRALGNISEEEYRAVSATYKVRISASEVGEDSERG